MTGRDSIANDNRNNLSKSPDRYKNQILY